MALRPAYSRCSWRAAGIARAGPSPRSPACDPHLGTVGTVGITHLPPARPSPEPKYPGQVWRREAVSPEFGEGQKGGLGRSLFEEQPRRSVRPGVGSKPRPSPSPEGGRGLLAAASLAHTHQGLADSLPAGNWARWTDMVTSSSDVCFPHFLLPALPCLLSQGPFGDQRREVA